ncbi:sporulation integral membrane protein YlbJ [Fictibacillus macauensis]|nr:sporulation integral membrane protein YlbJ [Fictibacillus macauensis]
MKWSVTKSVFLAICGVTLAISVMIFPKQSFEASLTGLKMWWDVVFPSLLPFFILSELLIGFGVVHFVGVLFEPLMRPLFKVPGAGGFVWAMGLSSGFPAGAKLTSRLWQEKVITTTEAERLVSFTNSSNPLFIFGAVSVGFFKDPALGIILALAHYIGNFFVGLTMRFHGNEPGTPQPEQREKRSPLQKMHEARINDGRPIGKLLGDAIQSSTTTLLAIGGFIILFSVINKVLTLLLVTPLVAEGLGHILSIFSLPDSLSTPFINGLFEITTGSRLTSLASSSLFAKCIIASFILAFSGFSVQAQVASILAETNIRFSPFFAARLLHGLFASVLAAILFPILYAKETNAAITTWATTHLSASTDSLWAFVVQGGAYVTLGTLVCSILLWGLRHSKNPRLH